jgi:uncharacterized membrane protein (UPF0127 family)
MKKRMIAAVLVGMMFQSYGCKDTSEKKILTKEVTFTKEGELTLKKAVSDSVVAQLDIEFAESEYETQTGLMYRKSMQPNRAMLFIFKDETQRSFYMKNTEFALDIIYIDSEYKIVSIQKNAKPLDKSSLPSQAPAKYVLEVNAGQSDQWGLAAGDVVQFSKN